MAEFMRNGGVPMWVILLFGLLGLVAAALFARAPAPHKLPVLWALGLATVLSILGGTAAAMGNVFHFVARMPETSPGEPWAPLLFQGLSEAMAPSVLGFTLLSLIAFVAAVGLRRLPRA